MFLNPSVTSFSQHMDQGVIVALKNYYSFNLMKNFIEGGANLILFFTFWKSITITDVNSVSKA